MSAPLKVMFVCLHGSAKSLIAAEHFRRLARDSGLDVDVTSAGVEPDERVPPHVIQGLADDGFDVAAYVPRPVAESDFRDADRLVSFGCDIETGSRSPTVIRWDDVPAVSDGYATARDDIVRRLRTLLADVT